MDMLMAQVVVMVSLMYTYLQIHQIEYINIYSFVYVKKGRERETARVQHDPSCSLLYLNKGQCGHTVNLKSSAKPLSEWVQEPVNGIRKDRCFLTLSNKCHFHTIQCQKETAGQYCLFFSVLTYPSFKSPNVCIHILVKFLLEML